MHYYNSFDYRDESHRFINVAFDLLNRYEYAKDAFGPDYMVALRDPYALRISDKGRLNLVRVIETDTGRKAEVVGHAYSEKYSQITYIGKLLAVYLENLQVDEG